jgi:hypothetical protein
MVFLPFLFLRFGAITTRQADYNEYDTKHFHIVESLL